MRLSSLSKLLGCIIALGFAAVLGTSWYALRELKVNGPLYKKVVQGKDLVADILPPPAYIIEAFLEVNLLYQEPGSLEQRGKRLDTLRKEYFDRHAHWTREDLPEDIREGILSKAHVPALGFWKTLEETFLPAVRAGDAARIRRALDALRGDYAVHRAAIDAVVEIANARNSDVEAEAVRLEKLLSTVMVAVGVVGILLVLLCVVGLNVSLVQPLLRMRSAMAELARGNHGSVVPALGRGDEIGDMARSVEVFREAAVRREQMEAEMSRRRQDLDLERAEREREKGEISQQQIKALRDMADRVEGTARQNVAFVVEQMEAVAGVVGNLAQSTVLLRDNSEGVASAAEEALVTMQQASRSAAELTRSIQSVAGKAEDTRAATGQAVAASRNVASRIQSLSQTIDRIETFTQTINDIARNTNLLALNAGVEAARSGEHGRGFAVIAQEVKALSEQTAQATANIRELIAEVQGAKDGALAAVGEIGTAIEHASAMTVEIGSALKEQATAVGEISHNVAETERAASDVAQRINVIAGQTQATGAETEQANSICSNVVEKVLVLQRELIQSLRSSSSDVDRRSEARIELRTSIDVRTRGATVKARLINISSGGAMLEGNLGGVGAPVSFTLPGSGTRISSRIVSSDGISTSVRFEAPVDVSRYGLAAAA
ncbi:MAG: HAMP domain-containing methyl-accepting chemotaxis protein [Hyphomicrobiaceae bacterium]|nr:HAMP domain-containing methyl-accepting chemotaxis protein [Hyphomicrobiaceae bacterium]